MSTIIYHVTTPSYFKSFENEDFFYPKGLKDEGFIHCSYKRQLPRIFKKYYGNEKDIVLLKLDSNKIKAELKIELAPSVGEGFPHIYGEINMDAVIEILYKENPFFITL